MQDAKDSFENRCRALAAHLGRASKELLYIIHRYEHDLGPQEVLNVHDFFDDEKNREYLSKRLAKFLNVMKRVNLEKPKVETVIESSHFLDSSREG